MIAAQKVLNGLHLKDHSLKKFTQSLEFLKKNLDDYIKGHFKSNLVKVVRHKNREGLIRTRMAGANVATGDVLIFFDSHIECNVNWLPPLIEPIALNKTISVCPFIDVAIKFRRFS